MKNLKDSIKENNLHDIRDNFNRFVNYKQRCSRWGSAKVE